MDMDDVDVARLAAVESVLNLLENEDFPESEPDDMLDVGHQPDQDGDGEEASSIWKEKERIDEEEGIEMVSADEASIPADALFQHLGYITKVISDTVVITSDAGTPVLDIGSVLAKYEDRAILGEVFDTFGPVQKPMYSVRFASVDEMTRLGLVQGVRIAYIQQASSIVFAEALKKFKGSDASNVFDEEVGEQELDFSDDEKEQEYKRKKKRELVDASLVREPYGRYPRAGHGPTKSYEPPRDYSTAVQPSHAPTYSASPFAAQSVPYIPLARTSAPDYYGRVSTAAQPFYRHDNQHNAEPLAVNMNTPSTYLSGEPTFLTPHHQVPLAVGTSQQHGDIPAPSRSGYVNFQQTSHPHPYNREQSSRHDDEPGPYG